IHERDQGRKIMLVQIFKGTPPWVWALLAGLIALGAFQLRDRAMSATRLLILPVVMVLLSLLSTLSAFEMASAALIGWVVGGTLAAAALRQMPAPAGTARGEGLYHVAGSWWPLILILCIFCIRYVVSVTLAIDPSWRHHVPFQSVVGLLSGTFAGVFLG